MNTTRLLLLLTLILLSLIPCTYATATPTTPSLINLYTYDSTTQPIAFPSYIKLLSPVIDKMIDGKFKESKEKKIMFQKIHSNVLREFQDCVNLLAKAARDTNGKPVASENINRETIFVHSLLEEAFSKKIDHMENFKLKQLSQTAHFLQIDQLTDVISYFIAKRIHNKAYWAAANQQEFDQYLRIQWSWIPEDQCRYIEEYLYLIQHGKRKKTIADYIGLHGQPYFNHCIDLKNTGLTSLKGIEYLKDANKTTTLFLQDNFILDGCLDLNFPQKPFHSFPNLTCLNLSNNQLRELPSGLFLGLPLKWLYLNNNQLEKVHNDTLQGQKQLKVISLSYNCLTEIPEGLFSNSSQLENIFISHNLLTKIPELFQGCPQLHELSLAGNGLTELPENLFQYQTELISFNLCENPMMAFPDTLFRPLTKLERFFLEEEQKEKGLTESNRQDLHHVVLPTFCPDNR